MLGAFELDGVYCGDAAKMMKQLPDGCIDLTVTSPPYDNLRTYNGYVFDFEAIAAQLYRVTKTGGVVVWVVGDETVNGSESGSSFRQSLHFMGLGFSLYDTMFYKKNTSGHPPSRRYGQVIEYMFVLSKGRPVTVNLIADKKNIWAGEKNFGAPTNRKKDGTLTTRKKSIITEFGVRSNVWEYAVGYGYSSKDDIAFQHPAIFPELLAADHILSWSIPGDVVLDPMAGSGTTLKMAKSIERHYIGFDISSEYVELAKRRLEGTGTPLPLFTAA